jgi:hypothetical protein
LDHLQIKHCISSSQLVKENKHKELNASSNALILSVLFKNHLGKVNVAEKAISGVCVCKTCVGKRREGKEKTKKQIRRPNKKLKKKIESKKKNSVYPLFFFFKSDR